MVKIALINAQVGIGNKGTYLSLWTNIWKLIFPHQLENIKDISNFVDSHKIDIVASVEMEGESFRSGGVEQSKIIADSSRI